MLKPYREWQSIIEFQTLAWEEWKLRKTPINCRVILQWAGIPNEKQYSTSDLYYTIRNLNKRKGYPTDRSLKSCKVLEMIASLLPQNFMFVILSTIIKGRISIITSKSQNSGYKTSVMVNTLETQLPLEDFRVFARGDINQWMDQQIVWCYGKERNGEKSGGLQCVFFFSPPPLPFLLSPQHLPQGLIFLLSPIFLCYKIKDSGYNTTNINKLSPAQNTPALQTRKVTTRQLSWFPYPLRLN